MLGRLRTKVLLLEMLAFLFRKHLYLASIAEREGSCNRFGAKKKSRKEAAVGKEEGDACQASQAHF